MAAGPGAESYSVALSERSKVSNPTVSASPNLARSSRSSDNRVCSPGVIALLLRAKLADDRNTRSARGLIDASGFRDKRRSILNPLTRSPADTRPILPALVGLGRLLVSFDTASTNYTECAAACVIDACDFCSC